MNSRLLEGDLHGTTKEKPGQETVRRRRCFSGSESGCGYYYRRREAAVINRRMQQRAEDTAAQLGIGYGELQAFFPAVCGDDAQ